MTEKVKSWWSEDGKWFCMLVNDGVNQATVSLTPEEATALAKDASPETFAKLDLVRRQRDDMTAAFNSTLTPTERARP
jgi:hypothetical protein